MKSKYVRKLVTTGILMISSIAILSGCGERNSSEQTGVSTGNTVEQTVVGTNEDKTTDNEFKQTNTGSSENLQETRNQELMVTFGDEGEAFVMHLYDNDTAAAIAGYVGSSDWRLPIYHYDDYEGYEYYQYYDIPSRYEIASNPETVTSAKAGEVYYSEPNRMILFYQDAEVSQELTPVGYIDNTEEFVQAVEENPVLEGWGNKIVLISDGE